MQAAKWVGLALAAAMGLAAVALLLVLVFFDPNDYRDDLERLVEAQTGRDLTLEGDLSLSVFPSIAVELGPAELSEAPGFGDQPFVAIQRVRVSARLWPLLRGAFEIGTLRLEGARLQLITDAQGRENWADLADRFASAPAPSETAPEDGAGPSPFRSLAGLEIEDAAVTIEDRREDSRRVVRSLDLKTGRLESGTPFPVQTRFIAELSPILAVETSLKTTVTADLDANRYVLDRLEAEAVLKGEGYPAEGQPVRMTSAGGTFDVGAETYLVNALDLSTAIHGENLPADGVPVTATLASLAANLATQTLTTTGLRVDAAGAALTGSLSGSEILDAPRLTGRLALAPVSLRDLLPKLGIEVPVTRDPEVLKRLAFAADVVATPTSAEFSDLQLTLDDTTARGTFGIADLEAQALRFDLDVDRINADRYLSPAEDVDQSTTAGAEEPTEIPVELLRTLNLRGTLDIGEAIFAGIRFTQMRLGVTAREGDMSLNPLEAQAYGGGYRGEITFNAAGDTARVRMNHRVTGVDFAPLFKDLFKTERVTGKGNVNAELSAVGRDTAALVRTLNGTLGFDVQDGALEGTDLWYEIRRARALIRQQTLPARSGPERTPFTALHAQAKVTDGVLSTSDLQLALQYLRVGGQATVDLVKDDIEGRLEATVLRIPADDAEGAALQELVDAKIPIRLSGTLASPKVLPDLEGYLKNRVRERLDEEKDKLEEKLRDRLQDRLQRALGGGDN